MDPAISPDTFLSPPDTFRGALVPAPGNDGNGPISAESFLTPPATYTAPPTAPDDAPEKRSALGEIWSQLKAGAFIDLPRMAGKAMQYASSPGRPTYEAGKSLADDAGMIEKYTPELAPSPASDGAVTGAFAKGARMLPASVAPAVGAGLLLSGVGVPAAAATVGGAALTAVPFALSKGQETYEKGLAKHGLTPEQAAQMPDDPRVKEALDASRLTGGIEFAANTAGGALAGRLAGVGGRFAGPLVGRVLNRGEQTAAESVLRQFTAPQSVGRFALDTLETGGEQLATQMGRAGAEAGVEHAYGYDTTTPWEAAKEIVGPTIGMTALTAPVGIPARVAHARRLAGVVAALENPEAPRELRSAAAQAVYDGLAQKSPDAAHNFALRSFDALHGEQETGSAPYGLTLDSTAVEPFTLRALHGEETPAPVATTTPEPEPGPITKAVEQLRPEPPAVSLDERPAGTEGPAIQEVNQAAAPSETGVDGLSPALTGGEPAQLRAKTAEEATLDEAHAWAKGRPELMRQTGEAPESHGQRVLDSYLRSQRREAGDEAAGVDAMPPAPTVTKAASPAGGARLRTVDSTRDDAITAIAKLGGIDYGQARKEWGAMTGDERKGLNRHVMRQGAGTGHVFRTGGRSLDEMRGALAEHGYLPEDATINDLHRLVEDGAAGRHSYATKYDYEPRAQLLEAEREAAVSTDSPAYRLAQRYAEKVGIDMTGWDEHDMAEFVGMYRRWIQDKSRAAESPKSIGEMINERRRLKGAFLMPPEEPAASALIAERSAGNIDVQAHEAATSPLNDRPEPTAAQIEAGNYRKGHIRIHGLDISIENPKGSVRRGVDENGRKWQTELAHHYGYIKGTVGKDKDHVDVFVGPHPESQRAYVVDQVNPKTGKLDEHKILLGFSTPQEARAGYLANYDESGRSRIGAITETTADGLKDWLSNDNQEKAFADSRQAAAQWSPDRATVESAFPGQTVTEEGDGFTVALKNGARVKVLPAGDIRVDIAAAEAAHGRKIAPDERPVASFQRLDPATVITLTEQGAGEIHHETFHAAMALALTEGQRDAVLKKYGSEEAAAAQYQRLRDSGGFARKEGYLFLQDVYRFFDRLHTLFDPAAGVLRDVATGKVWEQTGTTAEAVPLYSFGKGEEYAAGLSGMIKEARARVSAFTDQSAFMKSDVKPALKAAGDGLAASWDGLKAAVHPMGRTPEAEEAGRILIEGMGRMEHGREQFIARLNKATMQAATATTRTAKVLDLMKSSATLADRLFATMPESERIDFMQRMDTGQEQATPELQRTADAIKVMFQEKAAAVQALGTGALENVRDSYFPHYWKRGEEAEKVIRSVLSKRPLEGGKGFAKGRVFDDVMAGIEAGYEPVSTNPVDLVFLKMGEMDKYLNTHVAFQAMEKSGLVPLIPAGEKLPQGYTDIAGRYGIVTKKGFMNPESGMEEMRSYRYVAREDVAQVFNNYLSESLYNNKYVGKPFTAYMTAANALNQFQLGVFSAFHAGFTSMEAVISHGALGVKALSRGDFKEAARYLKQAPAAFYLNPKLGDKVLKAWMGDQSAAKEMPQIVQWLEMAGARRAMDTRFQTNATQKMLQAWTDGNKIGAGLRSLPAVVEQSARPIMEWLVPRQKFGVFAEMAHDWATRHPDATHEETRKAMQQIWNRVDSRLGQVVYDRLFVRNMAKNLAQALIRAPGWTGGTVLEVGGGLKDIAGYARDLAKGKKPEMSDRAAYTLSMLVTTAVANATLTALFTGEPPKDWKDLVAFRTGNRDEHGNPERFMLPTYMKDVYAYAQKPGTTLLHKTHPLLSLISDVAQNRDYYGTEIRHPGDNPVMQLAEVAGFTARAFVPFWMKGVAKEHERGGSVASMTAPLLGVMPAPADMNKTAAERLSSELMQARQPNVSRTKEQFEQGQLIMHLTGEVRRNAEGARQDVQEAVREGKVSRLQAMHIFRNAQMAPIQVAFKRLSYEEAQRVYEVANEREKRLLRPMLAKKRRTSLAGG
jgi:hypothetical protein